MKKSNYINPNDLHFQLIQFKQTNEISNQLGEMLMAICDHILCHSNFRNYEIGLKAEMKSYALLLLMRYLKNIDPETRDARNAFNYITTTIFNAYRQVLKKYYKHLNLQRELQQLYIDKLADDGIHIKNEYLENFELEK